MTNSLGRKGEKMNRNLLLALTALGVFAGCKKQEAAAPPPVIQAVVAPEAPVVQPGMEAENPAEKEGQP